MISYDLDDMPLYATIEWPSVRPARRRSKRPQMFLYLGSFNPRNGTATMRRVVLNGVDRLERDLRAQGVSTFSNTNIHRVRAWVEQREKESRK